MIYVLFILAYVLYSKAAVYDTRLFIFLHMHMLEGGSVGSIEYCSTRVP